MLHGLFYFCLMKNKSGFEKFYKQKKGAAKKEEFRQEKRKWKKELTEKTEEKRKNLRQGIQPKIERVQKAEQMPLNKYIAHSGVCSRRDAVDLIKGGKVKVNNLLITEPGHKISENDVVAVGGKKIHPVKNLVYILLNKPKDY